MRDTLRVLVAAGGTGGHLYPGLAVLEAMRAEYEGTIEATFVGTSKGIEARVLPPMGERLELLDVRPLNGVRGVALAGALSRLPRAAWQCARLVGRVRPHLMLSVGGYASGPVTAMSIARGVPTAVIEPNAVPGLTNRVLGRFVTRAYVSWEETEKHFRAGRARTVGTPVRKAFLAKAQAAVDARREIPHVLLLGGSQGARVLNENAPKAYAILRAKGLHCTMTHQTGTAMYEAVAAEYARSEFGNDVTVSAFIDDVASAMARADLMLARSGAGAVAEACVLGRPALYVPLPTAADDHQRKNAEAVAARGAAKVLPQSELSPETLAAALESLLRDRTSLAAMATAARALGRAEAATQVAHDLLEITRRNTLRA